jgi:hypothetical protein
VSITRPPGSRPPLRRAGRIQTVLHLVLALLGWIAFGWFWFEVMTRTPTEESAVGVLVVGILLVVSLSLTVAWIRHNLVLAQKHEGRRRRTQGVTPDWSRDVLGRTVAGPSWETLQEADHVEIEIDSRAGRKTYRAA